MSKKIENEPSSKMKEKSIYYDCYINVKIREFIDKNAKYGQKGMIQKKLAEACGVSFATMKRCISGYSTLRKYNQIKGLAEYTGLDLDILLSSVELPKTNVDEKIKRELPEDLIIKGVELHNSESYNVLCGHIYRNGNLFPVRDDFLNTLDYLICEEKFISSIADTLKSILESFKKELENAIEKGILSQEEVNDFVSFNNYEELKEKLSKSNFNRIKVMIRDIVTEKDIDDAIRNLAIKYISENLKK